MVLGAVKRFVPAQTISFKLMERSRIVIPGRSTYTNFYYTPRYVLKYVWFQKIRSVRNEVESKNLFKSSVQKDTGVPGYLVWGDLVVLLLTAPTSRYEL